jgi:hypothetical protein
MVSQTVVTPAGQFDMAWSPKLSASESASADKGGRGMNWPRGVLVCPDH